MLTGYSASNIISRILLLVFTVMTLQGCSLEEDILGGGFSSVNNGSTVNFSGSVGDGPVTGATVAVYSSQGALLGSFASDSTASYHATLDPAAGDYPLRLEVSGGIDLVTGRAPDFKMVSVLTSPSNDVVNINPFSTLIVNISEQLQGGLNAGNLAIAEAAVMDKLSFGLDKNTVSDPIHTPVTDNRVAHIVKASESLGEMVRRTRDLHGLGRHDHRW